MRICNSPPYNQGDVRSHRDVQPDFKPYVRNYWQGHKTYLYLIQFLRLKRQNSRYPLWGKQGSVNPGKDAC